MKLVYVKWEDCRMDTNAPMYPVQAKPPIIGESAGWLIKEDNRAVYLCMDVFEKEETESEASVRHVVTIPRRQIIEHRVFELPEDEAQRIFREEIAKNYEEVSFKGKHPFKIYTADHGQAVETPTVPYMQFTDEEKQMLNQPGEVQLAGGIVCGKSLKQPSRNLEGAFILEEEMRAKWAASCVDENFAQAAANARKAADHE